MRNVYSYSNWKILHYHKECLNLILPQLIRPAHRRLRRPPTISLFVPTHHIRFCPHVFWIVLQDIENPPPAAVEEESAPLEPSGHTPQDVEEEQEQEEDVDMEIEVETPQPATTASPQPSLEEGSASPAGEAADKTEAGQDEELPIPTPAESPETALADMVEDITKTKLQESAESTPSVEGPQRTEGAWQSLTLHSLRAKICEY